MFTCHSPQGAETGSESNNKNAGPTDSNGEVETRPRKIIRTNMSRFKVHWVEKAVPKTPTAFTFLESFPSRVAAVP